MHRHRQRVVAANEIILREVNEAIARGQWPGEEDDVPGFRCECGVLACNRPLGLTPREYEAVRTDARRFVVFPGHELTDVETVVETHAGYVVVEKDGEGASLAEANDPRA